MGDKLGSFMQELAERLSIREAELVRRLEKVQADRRRTRGPLDPDFAEQAVERENDQVLDALDSLERGELVRTRAALRRLDAGCLGICDDCGEDIDPARMDVDPSVDSCIGCAEAREARGGARTSALGGR